MTVIVENGLRNVFFFFPELPWNKGKKKKNNGKNGRPKWSEKPHKNDYIHTKVSWHHSPKKKGKIHKEASSAD